LLTDLQILMRLKKRRAIKSLLYKHASLIRFYATGSKFLKESNQYDPLHNITCRFFQQNLRKQMVF
jgi:hypothetical protein